MATMEVILARAADTAESNLIKVSSTGACDVLSTQKTVAVEVSSTVVGIGEETSSRACETVWSLDSIRHYTTSSPEDLPHGTSVDCGEQNSHGICLRHADVIDVGIQWPRAHITNVVTCELVSAANWVANRE